MSKSCSDFGASNVSSGKVGWGEADEAEQDAAEDDRDPPAEDRLTHVNDAHPYYVVVGAHLNQAVSLGRRRKAKAAGSPQLQQGAWHNVAAIDICTSP